MGELNDMLTEAGETFEQKEAEIAKLKELTAEYEQKMEQQVNWCSFIRCCILEHRTHGIVF